MSQVFGRNAGSPVAHAEYHGLLRDGQPQLHRPVLSEIDGIVDQIAQNRSTTVGIDGDHHLVVGKERIHCNPLGPGYLGDLLHHLADQIAGIAQVRIQRCLASLIPGYFEKILKHAGKARHLLVQQFHGPALVGIQVVPTLEKQVRGHADGGDRGPQLMADV